MSCYQSRNKQRTKDNSNGEREIDREQEGREQAIQVLKRDRYEKDQE